MRQNPHLIRVLLLAWALLIVPAVGQDEQPPPNEAWAKQIDVESRFEGTVMLLAQYGQRPVRVVLENWGILNEQTVDTFPTSGLMLMELRGGEVITRINDQKQEREVGDFWVVPEGASLSITTGDDTASLQVLAVQPEEIR